mmetsp:Transcript_6936/g.6102  ORF Transcript_6936/g.6102 Transcript_6936/m.6102 type:complete len:122 (+) Transcript_6936:163-528(+)
MLVFSVILILIEEAISFTQAYHLAVIIFVQILLALGIHINPVALVLIYEVLFRRFQAYVYANLAKDSLLPLISNDARSVNTSGDKHSLVYDCVRLMLGTVFLMTIRNGFAPMFLSYFSAPW